MGPMPASRSIARALGTSAIVATAAMVGGAVHVYYLTEVGFAQKVRERFGPVGAATIARTEMVSLGAVVLVAALVGSLCSERYGLGGIGDGAKLRAAGKLILIAAPCLGAASYLLLGRSMAVRIPGYYPASVFWASCLALQGALCEEVVARYGMMTIFCGVVRRPWIANVLQAVFFTALGAVGLSFYGLRVSCDALVVASLVVSVAIHLSLGAIYARYGLLASMLFHFVLGLRFVAHALVDG
jgi:hypothetical protein